MTDSHTRAGWIVAATAAVAFGAALVWCASSLTDAKQSATDAVADTAACQQLTNQITAARRSPTANGPTDDDIGPRLERAMTAGEIDGVALTRVAPQPPRMIGRTGTARRTTQVVLERVTLKQALSFVGSLAGNGVTLDTFELTVPTGDNEPTDEWNAELAVSQLVKTPRPAVGLLQQP